MWWYLSWSLGDFWTHLLKETCQCFERPETRPWEVLNETKRTNTLLGVYNLIHKTIFNNLLSGLADILSKVNGGNTTISSFFFHNDLWTMSSCGNVTSLTSLALLSTSRTENTKRKKKKGSFEYCFCYTLLLQLVQYCCQRYLQKFWWALL